jgi:SPP1 family predicted phage head-tail adaptor
MDRKWNFKGFLLFWRLMLGAGDLNKRITIQKEAYNEPTGGQLNGKQNEAWVNVATVWANIKTNSSTETVVGAQVQQVGTYTITMRYRRGVDSNQRLEYRGRYFQIQGVTNVDENNTWLVLDCSEWKGQN